MRIRTWPLALLPLTLVGICARTGSVGSSAAPTPTPESAPRATPTPTPIVRATPTPVSGIRVQVQQRIEGGAYFPTPRPPMIRPLPGATIMVQAFPTGRVISRKQADRNGKCGFLLSPATYVVAPLQPDPKAYGTPPQSVKVTVRRGHVVSITMTYLLLAP